MTQADARLRRRPTLRPVILALAVVASPVQAQRLEQDLDLPQGDITAFETCFIQMMIDNPDNPMVGVSGPVICGERTIPMGQTCDPLDYLLFERRAVCKPADLEFWQAQVAARETHALSDGREGIGVLHRQGLERCAADVPEGDDRRDCLIEIYWRTAMTFIAADLHSELMQASESGPTTEGQ